MVSTIPHSHMYAVDMKALRACSTKVALHLDTRLLASGRRASTIPAIWVSRDVYRRVVHPISRTVRSPNPANRDMIGRDWSPEE